MISTNLWFLLTGAFVGSTIADEQYKSRPDLSPPRLNITIPATEGVAPGYIFVGPYPGFAEGNGLPSPEQPAGYILRDNGDLVWSSLGYLSGWVGNLQVASWKGKPVISAFQGTIDPFHGRGWGHPTLLNDKYENIREIYGGNHKVISIHEFKVLTSGSGLVEIYQPLQADLTAYDGKQGASWIVDALFQEIDLETGDLIFEWSSLEHVPPSHGVVTLSSGYAGDGLASTSPWDYFHLNSIDKDDDGNYLISARHTSTLYKINRTSGEIIWRLGGKHSDFTYPKDLTFGFQHDARFLKTVGEDGIEHISFFDNAARANGHLGGGIDIIYEQSRAKIITLDTKAWTASLEVSLTSPEGLSAASQGNTQVLPNGNLFVNWGQAGAITEYRRSDGKAIFHAYVDSGELGQVQNYRGFRFPWTGHPKETPAIVALNDGAGSTTAYVSWNGDTEAAKWKFFAIASSSDREAGNDDRRGPRYLGEAKRSGFETSFKIPQNAIPSAEVGSVSIYAEAFDKDGQILTKSDPTVIQKSFDGTKKHEDKEEFEL